ncbi:prepilin-type N-terminal cleavage/methylation domain-containing protein [uncultured Fibrobacter sp.]|uniref:prepilin-type N-terminal cleavage/methylation domain-containing protein n=1 Tax=uncultured Fibrobacter sp. TaxID=261512 RepID=UPI0025F12861|nr:prepilin-type N-terminal cleavage/methylation domain-containing protein [uncultured Fibrobacter sp.]
MLNHGSKKNGYTLVEVLVVVTIMGVLSSMGVAGLRGAVINARIKDCAQNTAAFLERVANDANRLSKRLCVKMAGDNEQTLYVYMVNDCGAGSIENVEPIDSLTIEAPARFSCDDQVQLDDLGDDWADNGALFIPRIGLSAAPSEGYVCMQYGTSYAYGLVEKNRNNNMLIPQWRTGSYWNKL